MDVLLHTTKVFNRSPNQAKSEQCISVSPWSLQSFYATRAVELHTFVLACWLYVVPVNERDRQTAVLFQQCHVNSQQLSMQLSVLPGSNTLQFQYHPLASTGLPTVTLQSARPLQVKQWMHLTVECIDGSVRLYINQQYDSHYLPDDKLKRPVLYCTAMHLGWSLNGLLHNVILGHDITTVQSAITPIPHYSPNDVVSQPPLRCYPLDSITELLAWTPHCDPLNISSVPLRHRPPIKQNNRVIHCHDLRGGYTDDAYAPGASPVDLHATALTAKVTARPPHDDSHAPSMLSYNFTHWHLIDIFIYFSHHCITIPPQQWVHTAHRNGVLCLGTLITEWTAGIDQNRLMLSDEATSNRCADQLVAIAVYYGFDGWLINIEADLPADDKPNGTSHVQRLIRFTAYLREQLHKAIPHGMIIMYDSINLNNAGKVEWQSELNHNNTGLFMAADAFFTDYKWQPEAVARSAAVATSVGRPATEVFMGIDVFGRGSWKHGLDTWQAVQHCFEANLSVALFAPSWTAESLCTGNRATRAMMRRYERKFWQVDDFDELELTADQWQPVAATNGTGSKPWQQQYDAQLGCMVSVAPNAKAGTFATQQMQVDLTKLVAAQQSLTVPSITCCMQYKGSQPNVSDQVRITITVYNTSGKAVDVYDSGLKTCTSEWRSIEYEINPKWLKASHLICRVEGKDAEGWAGFYGPQVTCPLLLVSKPPQPTIAGVVRSRRLSFAELLPVHHSVHTGVGRKHGIVYSNYDQQSTRSLTDYRLLNVDKGNELEIDDHVDGDVVPFDVELDDVSLAYPTPALRYGATVWAEHQGVGYWLAGLRLLALSKAAASLQEIDKLYVYINFRHPSFIMSLNAYMQVQFTNGSMTQFDNKSLAAMTGAVHSIMEDLKLLELPTAGNDQVCRMVCELPGAVINGRVITAVDLVIGDIWRPTPPHRNHSAITSLTITDKPLPLDCVSIDRTSFTRCPDVQPTLRSIHWKFTSITTGVETYSAVLDWSDVTLDAHVHALYQVYCNHIKICSTRHTSCWVDSYVGTMQLGERQQLYRVEVL